MDKHKMEQAAKMNALRALVKKKHTMPMGGQPRPSATVAMPLGTAPSMPAPAPTAPMGSPSPVQGMNTPPAEDEES